MHMYIVYVVMVRVGKQNSIACTQNRCSTACYPRRRHSHIHRKREKLREWVSDWVRERGEVCSLMLCHRQHRVDVMPRNTANSFRVLFIRTNFLACTFRRPLTISCIIVGVYHLVRVRRRRNIHITPKKWLPLSATRQKLEFIGI